MTRRADRLKHLEELLADACRVWGVEVRQVRGREREQEIADARAFVVRTLRDPEAFADEPAPSLKMLGRLLGGRDHSTIANCALRADILMAREGWRRARYEAAREAFRARRGGASESPSAPASASESPLPLAGEG